MGPRDRCVQGAAATTVSADLERSRCVQHIRAVNAIAPRPRRLAHRLDLVAQQSGGPPGRVVDRLVAQHVDPLPDRRRIHCCAVGVGETLDRIGWRVGGEASSPNRAATATLGNPCSAVVGTLGRCDSRCGPAPTASTHKLQTCACFDTTAISLNRTSTRPASRSGIGDPMPCYSTPSRLVPDSFIPPSAPRPRPPIPMIICHQPPGVLAISVALRAMPAVPGAWR